MALKLEEMVYVQYLVGRQTKILSWELAYPV
jgi:hypothetical protein